MKRIKIIRKDFPRVIKYQNTENSYIYEVDCRSRKYGMSTRHKRSSEEAALELQNRIKSQIVQFGTRALQSNVCIDNARLERIMEKLQPFNATLEEAVERFLTLKGNEIKQSILPTVRELTEEWLKSKITSTLDPLTHRTINEVKSYARFISRHWGDLRVDMVTEAQIKSVLESLQVKNITRRQYLRYVKMFFHWVIDVKRIKIEFPIGKIPIKIEELEITIFSPEQVERILACIKSDFPELLNWFIICTFVGCRPSETDRMTWDDVLFKTNELHVNKESKTGWRHPRVEAQVLEYIKTNREANPDQPLIPSGIEMRLKRFRKHVKDVLHIDWAQDVLRHSGVSYFYALKQDWNMVEFQFGHSVRISKKHYQKSIPKEDVEKFWNLLKNPVDVKVSSDIVS